jgi:catechol 2,3-dioxygenase-like lactoylglutathione lyase family enzyme
MTAGDKNEQYELRGINHLALVCKDMQVTVDFYTQILGMPLTKTLDLPNGMGQHFFFDCGNGDSLAFFWFPGAPKAAPGIASPARAFFDPGAELATAHGSMNHVAFDVSPEKIEEYRERLVNAGIEVTPIFNHDNSPSQVSAELTDDTFVRSIYFYDPDGILLEFASWETTFDESDIPHKAATEADEPRYLAMAEAAKQAVPASGD